MLHRQRWDCQRADGHDAVTGMSAYHTQRSLRQASCRPRTTRSSALKVSRAFWPEAASSYSSTPLDTVVKPLLCSRSCTTPGNRSSSTVSNTAEPWGALATLWLAHTFQCRMVLACQRQARWTCHDHSSGLSNRCLQDGTHVNAFVPARICRAVDGPLRFSGKRQMS